MRSGLVSRADTAAPFPAGNQSVGSILELLQAMAAGNDDMSSPSAGGTLTINSESLGSYDYVIKDGNQTVSSFTAADWFTATEDSRSAFVVVKGDLTIGAAQTFIPAVRKLFTAIYVTGSLTITGEISMSARGADHSSATGSNVSAAAIRIATGIYSSVTNPQVPAAGASGGAARASVGSGGLVGNTGAAGTNGETGGGGSGACGNTAVSETSGAGAAGTSFSGGPGGGAAFIDDGTDGATDGGPGGDASPSGTNESGGGAGNPGGAGGGGGDSGDTGTGGVLIIVCEGTFDGAGDVTAAGADGGDASDIGAGSPGAGGASGGGSVTILYGTDTGPTPTAAGGAAGSATSNGGPGGDGTARKLALA